MLCKKLTGAMHFNWEQVTKENAKGIVKSDVRGLKSENRKIKYPPTSDLRLLTSIYLQSLSDNVHAPVDEYVGPMNQQYHLEKQDT